MKTFKLILFLLLSGCVSTPNGVSISLENLLQPQRPVRYRDPYYEETVRSRSVRKQPYRSNTQNVDVSRPRVEKIVKDDLAKRDMKPTEPKPVPQRKEEELPAF